MTKTTDTHAHAREATPAELVAHHLLKLIGDHPAQVGPLRCARIVGGYTVPTVNEDQRDPFERYAIEQHDWTLRTLKDLVEALERGGLVARSAGPRPTLALTRAGHRALDALDRVPTPARGDASC